MKQINTYRANNTFNLDNFSIKDKEYLYQEQLLDDNDNVLKEVTYSPENLVESNFEYSYNINNQLVKEILIEEDEVTSNREIEYNDKGKIECEKAYYADDSFDKTYYKYDENDRLVETRVMYNDEEEAGRTEYIYEGELLVKICEYDEDGKPSASKSIEYDENKQPIEEITEQYGEKWTRVIVYDSNNRVSQTKRYNQEDLLKERITYTFDDSDRVVAIKEEGVEGEFYQETEYNDKGLIVLETQKDQNGILLRQIERSYDEENRINIVKVHVQGRHNIAPMHYQLRYEYL